MSAVKDDAKELIDGLPEDATWEDVAYAIYVRESIEAGIADIEAGRVFTQEEVEQHIRERLRSTS